jgi:hypothetical protein
MHWARALAVTAMLVGGTQVTQSAEKPKNAASPEEAVKYLLEAARSADTDGFLAQLGGHTRALFEMGKAIEIQEAALEEKFGKVAKAGARPSMKRELEKFTTQTIKLVGQARKGKDRVALTVWQIRKHSNGEQSIGEETWIGIKEDKGWKIILPEKGVIKEVTKTATDGKEVKVQVLQSREVGVTDSAAMQKMLTGAKQSLDELTKQIKAGKYRTRDEAETALKEAKSRLREK